MLKLILLLLFVSNLTYAEDFVVSEIYQPAAYTMPEKSYSYSLDLTQSRTSGIYDVNGTLTDFGDRQDYQRFQAEALFRYGMSEQFELRGGGRYRKNDSTDISGNNFTVAGVESIIAGLTYKLKPKFKKWIISFDAEIRHLLSKPTEAANFATEIDLSNEGTGARAGILLSHQLGEKLYLNGSTYIGKPATGQSSEVDYDINLFWVGSRFALGAGFDGVYSLGTDNFESTPALKPARATGSTGTINSINRSYMEPYLGANFAFSKHFRIEGRLAKISSAESWDQATTAGLNIVWQHKPVTTFDKVESNFKEYFFEASIVKVSPRGRFIKIDKGLTSDIAKGMSVDIFKYDYVGGNELIASGKVFEVGVDSSIIKVLETYKDENKVTAGMIVRGK